MVYENSESNHLIPFLQVINNSLKDNINYNNNDDVSEYQFKDSLDS